MHHSHRVFAYLDSKHVPYHLVNHPHSNSSVGSAISARVPMHQIAKAVILEDQQGNKLMAIIPADYKVSLSMLNEGLDGHYRLVKENAVYKLFEDCDRGAVPPLPMIYNMDAVCDDELYNEKQLYLESGDHETLINIDIDSFHDLMAEQKHAHISHQVIH